MSGKKEGFTIVELLVVIVVIAILAAITIVSFNGIQARANDARTRESVSQVEKALYHWAIDNGTSLLGGWGSTMTVSNGVCSDGSGGGFVFAGAYACTLEDMLVGEGLLPSRYFEKMPRNKDFSTVSTGVYSVMLYKCGGTPGLYALLWSLQNPTNEDATSILNLQAKCGLGVNLRDSYGMRAAKTVQLPS